MVFRVSVGWLQDGIQGQRWLAVAWHIQHARPRRIDEVETGQQGMDLMKILNYPLLDTSLCSRNY
jgi:hypothetical protein